MAIAWFMNRRAVLRNFILQTRSKIRRLIATVLVKASVAYTLKKVSGNRQKNRSGGFDKTYEIIPEFDVIKKLEKLTGLSAQIPFIQKDNMKKVIMINALMLLISAALSPEQICLP
ncbi:hypothetical protein EJ377_04230 [Chryseobacterium arthrosphaerae]|uniref:Uncharacterized protein n=1 Tax=Chryseobacterium arthrosphaerae TaxID=651561 RepID=A0A432DZG2_9FLAO|nr:hypothetical protein EJ377_04230 [Chryseobacterium arthrosphaerae]